METSAPSVFALSAATSLFRTGRLGVSPVGLDIAQLALAALDDSLASCSSWNGSPWDGDFSLRSWHCSSTAEL
jgi:hypothetical protein